VSKVKAISVIGLGKLGLCTAACFAKGGYKVIGVDIDSDKVDMLNEGKNPIQETGLTTFLKKYGKNLNATTDYRTAILNSDATFIVVATPSEADGCFSNKQLESSLEHIGKALKDKKGYHLVVVVCTVMPGTTEHVGKFILEKTSGKICNKDFGIAYNPEFIALGSVLHDFLNPDFLLIGTMNKKDADTLVGIYKKTCDNKPHFATMSLVNAEIAKISLNCYVTMKISYANSLAGICENVEGADAAIITSAIGLDSRIGRKYLKPGLGFGGPCFPRDNVAFAAFARKANIKAKLSEMVHEVNMDQIQRIGKIIKEMSYGIGKDKAETKVGILGLSYKPDTPIIEDSQAIDIVQFLLTQGYQITIYDPQAMYNAQGVFGDKVSYAKNAQICADRVDVLLLTTPWKEFKKVKLKNRKKKLYVLDCWRIFSEEQGSKVKVRYIGKSQ